VSLPAGTDGGDSLPEGGGDSLPRGKPGNPLGLRLVPGNQSTRLSARCLLNASAGCCSTAAITAAVTTTSKTTLLRFDAAIATFSLLPYQITWELYQEAEEQCLHCRSMVPVFFFLPPFYISLDSFDTGVIFK
jgi:hypothetical protein